jgi:transglutaminase-like putative cysteine protease
MARTITARLPHVLFALALLGAAGQPAAQEYYYGIELNGVLCGYARFAASPLQDGARGLIALTHEVVVRGTLLGAPVDSRITLTYHIDPATNAFAYHASAIEQGPTRLTSAVRIDAGRAFVSDGRGGPETTVDLPADVVLANTLVQSHLVTDFVAGSADRKTYRLFDGRDNAVRETAFTRVGTEQLTLAGRTFEAVVLDSIDRATGVSARLWLDPRTGIAVQTRHPGNRLSYLADATVVETVAHAARRPSLDAAIMASANVSIPDLRGITYMKVRVAARPSGLWLTPDGLNVPGQRFTGTVRDNVVEGVFEIEHARYGGAAAPPFPPDFGADPDLKRFLGADDYIQAGDPVLAAKARDLTAGARDCWEATRRLSAWVASNIKGTIPGGVTARGTYDQGAGDCGGHSFLLAALSRSVGIPAHVVWGCMYTPHQGGAFGQHAWNEVYMGAAGWIPLDTTASEVDYVDSGHLRIGTFGSVATSLNIRSIEILDHRGSGRGPSAQRPADGRDAR